MPEQPARPGGAPAYAGLMLPLAHAGHYVVWLLYALPVIIVVAAIVRSTLAQRRERHPPDPDDRSR